MERAEVRTELTALKIAGMAAANSFACSAPFSFSSFSGGAETVRKAHDLSKTESSKLQEERYMLDAGYY